MILLSCILMVCSVVCNIIGMCVLQDANIFLLALAVVSAISYIVFMLLHKRRLTIISVAFGAAFFIIKAAAFPVWQQMLCTLLYLLVLALYSATVSGRLRAKIPLILVFALPLAVHLGQDILYGFGILEVAVLCIMASLLCNAINLLRNEEKS